MAEKYMDNHSVVAQLLANTLASGCALQKPLVSAVAAVYNSQAALVGLTCTVFSRLS